MKYGFQNEEAKLFPPLILFSLVNICNNRCVHCEYIHRKKSPDYKKSYLSWDIYARAIDEISENKYALVRLTSNGEPLLHPDAIMMVEYAKAKKIYPLNLTTNGILLNEETAKKLVDAGIDTIDISIDAFSPQTYKKISGTDNLERVVSNVKQFIEINKASGNPVKVMVSIIDQNDVESELQQFVDYWSPIVDRVLVRTYYSGKSRDKLKEKYDRSIQRYPCPQFWKRVLITHDGHIRFCVDDWYDESLIGDLNRLDKIKDVWQSERYRLMRDAHSRGEYNKVPVCANCEDWRAQKWDYGYEYAIEKVLGRKLC